MDIKNFKQQLLDDLYKPYQNCMHCPLALQGRSRVVFGEGNPDARLLFVGEGPGAEEDVQGRPFVGRSGKLLSKVLDILEIKRTDVFIANIVKCRPPNNRKPTPLESKTCFDLLLKNQINIIKPTVICTLGASALQAFLNQDISISKIRGIQMAYKEMTLLPTYHPSYILRTPRELELLVSDIKTAYELSRNKK